MRYEIQQWYIRLKSYVGSNEFCSPDVPADIRWKNEMQALQEEGLVHRLGLKYNRTVKRNVVYWRLAE